MPLSNKQTRFLAKMFSMAAAVTLLCAPAHAKTSVQDVFNSGLRSAESENLAKAEKFFKKSVSMAPDNYASRFNLSLVYFQNNKIPLARQTLEQAFKLNPFDTRVSTLIACSQIKLKEYANAETTLRSITQKDPRDLSSHKKIAVLYLRDGNIDGSMEELTLLRNLAPSDLNGALLMAAAHVLSNDFPKAQQRLENLSEQLTTDISLKFYAYILEQNGSTEQAGTFYKNAASADPRALVQDVLSSIEESVIIEDIASIPYIAVFENSEISQRMAEKIEKEELPGAQPSSSQKSAAKRPFNLKGAVTETWETYQRVPKTSSPINGLNVTSNLKVEGKSDNGHNFSGEWEGYFNRWDNNKLDFYKINANKRNDYEVDIGKFSSKRFPTLVNFPTVLEGFRVYKSATPVPFESSKTASVPSDEDAPVNLGKLYEDHYIDKRFFKNFEGIALFGRTQKEIDYGDRKEKYENTYESSGQFEQWTQSYRAFSKLNNVLEVGTTASLTQDIKGNTIVSASTTPIRSAAMGIDGGLDLLDGDLLIDGEVAYGNYDEDSTENGPKSGRDLGWLFKSKYNATKTVTFNYELKTIGNNFNVEGASQTQDKISQTLDFLYKPVEAKLWLPMSHSVRFMPEVVDPNGTGETKQKYKTVQSVTDFKLPHDSKYTFDYKYYREIDKCDCTNYETLTFNNSFEYRLDVIQTVLKPSYIFERKDDMVRSATDEKTKEYVFNIENTSIKNLELEYSFERERKKYTGSTTKSYIQYINSIEATYTFIPSRLDVSIEASRDYKNPSDTNKTIIGTLSFEITYTSKNGDNKLNLEYEKKDNVYLPWSDSSAYYQQYIKCKYTHLF